MSRDSADSNTSQFIIYQSETARADKRLADLSQLAHQLSNKTHKND